MKDERLVSKMEGKTNFSRRLKQFDGLSWVTSTSPPPYFTTDLRHWYNARSNRKDKVAQCDVYRFTELYGRLRYQIRGCQACHGGVLKPSNLLSRLPVLLSTQWSCSKSLAIAIVTPLPKVLIPRSLSDDRPISVTQILSRIVEKYIVKRFLDCDMAPPHLL